MTENEAGDGRRPDEFAKVDQMASLVSRKWKRYMYVIFGTGHGHTSSMLLFVLQVIGLAVSGMPERTFAMATGVSAGITERSQRFAASLPPLRHERVRRVYLLRHGMTDWNLRGLVQGAGHDIELNEAGRAQASFAAEELAALPISLVASSHLARASETADAVHALHPAAKRLVDAGFGECNYGELEGRCLHSDDDDARRYKRKFDEVSANMELDADAGYPGGETANEVVARARKALGKLLQEACGPEDSHICIVGHGRINRLLLASLLYADATKFGHIEQGNTAISVVDYDPMIGEDGTCTGAWSEVVLNYCAHTEDRGAASGGCY